MKKIFNYLAAALLVGSSLAVASCSDDPEEATQNPEFPEQVQSQTILPGESCDIMIKPNMDWVVSIPNDQWFYIDNNGQQSTILHGTAVKDDQPIAVKVVAKDVETFDPVDPVEVTMKMGTESETIATLTIQHTERELKFYMAKIEEGEYVNNDNADLPNLDYSYEAEAKPNGFSVQLEEHGAFYNARLLVESNVPWTISVPEWIDARVNAEPATNGNAGQSEVELRANTASSEFSLNGVTDVVCKFVAKKSDDSTVDLAEIKVSMEDLTALLECNLPQEALFSPRGNYLPNASTYGVSLNGFITAPDGIKVIALTVGMNGGYEECSWVKHEIDPWSAGEKIQTRSLSINVDQQGHGWQGQQRQAVIFVLPATLADKTESDLVTEDWSSIREEYQKYLVTTITQEASTGYLSAMNSKAMEANKVKLEYDTYGMFDADLVKYCPWMASDEKYGFFYRLTYGDLYSSDGATLEINDNVGWAPEDGYTSYKIFGYNAGSAGENLPADNKWIQLQENRNAVTNVVESFTVLMNFDEEYTSTYGDGKKYAVIVFYDDQNIPCITLECTYDDGTGSGSEAGAVKFMFEEAANNQGATLTLLTASDPDYQKYFADFSSMNPSIYRLTYTQIETLNMTMITGLPNDGQNFQLIDDDADWIEVNPGQTGTTISVKDGKGVNGAKGACLFMSKDGSNAVIIVVELKLQ